MGRGLDRRQHLKSRRDTAATPSPRCLCFRFYCCCCFPDVFGSSRFTSGYVGPLRFLVFHWAGGKVLFRRQQLQPALQICFSWLIYSVLDRWRQKGVWMTAATKFLGPPLRWSVLGTSSVAVEWWYLCSQQPLFLYCTCCCRVSAHKSVQLGLPVRSGSKHAAFCTRYMVRMLFFSLSERNRPRSPRPLRWAGAFAVLTDVHAFSLELFFLFYSGEAEKGCFREYVCAVTGACMCVLPPKTGFAVAATLRSHLELRETDRQTDTQRERERERERGGRLRSCNIDKNSLDQIIAAVDAVALPSAGSDTPRAARTRWCRASGCKRQGREGRVCCRVD